MRQGGNTNTISLVNAVKNEVAGLLDVPDNLVASVVFDQSRFIKSAIKTLLEEGGIGVFLTAIMILVFLGSFRATIAVCLSIPLSALAVFVAISTSAATPSIP